MLTLKIKTLFLLLGLAGLLVALGWTRGQSQSAGVAPQVGADESGVRLPAKGFASVSPNNALGGEDSREDFEEAGDLYAYVQSLRVQERAGDAEALWEVSRVLDYCAAYAADPAGYARDTRTIAQLAGAATTAMAAARDRIGQRCVRFAPTDGFSQAALRAKRLEAARAGNLAAEAALLAMGEPLLRTGEYKQDLVERVRHSGDPEAFVAISPAMGIAGSGQAAYLGEVSGTQLTELAWLLAACRLGNDCGPGSVLMTSYCANGGICSRDGSQDFYTFVLDAGVPRQGADYLNGLVDSLMSDIGVAK